MKIYVAGKVNKSECDVLDLINKLEKAGHTITYKWTDFEVEKPYLKNLKQSSLGAESMKRGISDADIFILIWDEDLYGALIEAGIAISQNKKVYVIGKNIRESIFYALPKIYLKKSVDELIEELI